MATAIQGPEYSLVFPQYPKCAGMRYIGFSTLDGRESQLVDLVYLHSVEETREFSCIPGNAVQIAWGPADTPQPLQAVAILRASCKRSVLDPACSICELGRNSRKKMESLRSI